MAKGFKGKYFSLTAIQALVSEIKQNAEISRVAHCHNYSSLECEDEDPPPDLEDLLLQIEPFAPKVSRCQCHCNCFFNRRTRCAFLHALTVPKLRYLFKLYATGLAPPTILSFNLYR